MRPPSPPQAASLTEEEVVRLIRSLAGEGGTGLLVGIGDDAAVLAVGGSQVVVTTDVMVEGVHFNLDWTTPYDLGRRVMAANLSDLAAMGALPRWGFLSLGLPPRPQGDFLEGLMRGMVDLGRAHGLTLAGGDTVRSAQLFLNLCLLGLADPCRPALRSGARDGDAVCVTGGLGGSAAGLAWLAAGRDPADPFAAPALEAFLRPTPRVAAGRALAESGRVHAMMDLSDGLATDLFRLCRASHLGARVEAHAVPVEPAVAALAAELGVDPMEWALTGGEDFELLFTCSPGDVTLLSELAAEAEHGLAVGRVGTVERSVGVVLRGPDGEETEISLKGFDHFREEET